MQLLQKALFFRSKVEDLLFGVFIKLAVKERPTDMFHVSNPIFGQDAYQKTVSLNSCTELLPLHTSKYQDNRFEMMVMSGSITQLSNFPNRFGFRLNVDLGGEKEKSFLPAALTVRASNSNSQERVLAIDVGTGGTKAALVSSLGAVTACAFSPHPNPSPSVSGVAASVEQAVECWWEATIQAVQSCLNRNDGGTVRALAVTGQMQNVILLPQDERQPIPSAILYSDARAVKESTEVADMAGGADNLANITGTHQGASSLLAKLRWLDKHNPKASGEACMVLFGGHDYVVWKLCGNLVTDSTTASTTGLTDLTFKYSESLLTTVELGHWMDKLPPITSPNIPCGEVSASAAEELGSLSLKGLPVLHCCGDAGACTLGGTVHDAMASSDFHVLSKAICIWAGAGGPGSLYAYLGTSGWLAGSFHQNSASSQAISEVPRPSGLFTLGHPDPSLVFKTGSIMTAGGNLAWAASNIGFAGSVDMGQVDNLVNLEGAGSEGVLYLPYLNGERCPFEDGNARGCFIGISASTTRGHMFRAVMEGVAFAMRSSRDALNAGQSLDNGLAPLRLVGGGARSPVWPAIIAGVFGQTVEVLADAQEVGVKGAALLAGQYLGWHSSLSPSGSWVYVQHVFHPSKADVAVYNDMYDTYIQSYRVLCPVFQKLSALRLSLPYSKNILHF